MVLHTGICSYGHRELNNRQLAHRLFGAEIESCSKYGDVSQIASNNTDADL